MQTNKTVEYEVWNSETPHAFEWRTLYPREIGARAMNLSRVIGPLFTTATSDVNLTI